MWLAERILVDLLLRHAYSIIFIKSTCIGVLYISIIWLYRILFSTYRIYRLSQFRYFWGVFLLFIKIGGWGFRDSVPLFWEIKNFAKTIFMAFLSFGIQGRIEKKRPPRISNIFKLTKDVKRIHIKKISYNPLAKSIFFLTPSVILLCSKYIYIF